MLRETRTRWLALATAAVVVGLAALFAQVRNPGTAPGGAALPGALTDAPALDAARWASGRAAFARLDCTRCHALEGVGNPATPLDGVGARLQRAELIDWTLGTGVAADELPRGVLRSKQRAVGDPDLDALIDYLQHSR